MKDTLVSFDTPQHVELELDEMHPAASLGALWSFVQKKSKKHWVQVSIADATRYALNLWIALCKQTRQVVACVIGGRGAAACKQLWKGIPEDYKQGLCYSDFWKAYQSVLPDEHYQAVSKASGLTSHVERFNNTFRQRLARFVRKTLAFSKSEHMHLNCLHRFLVRYNLNIIRD